MRCPLFFDRFFRKFSGHQLLIGDAGFQFTGFIQNILQEIKAAFFKDGIILPGILILVTLYNGSNGGLVCLGKLRLDGLCDLLCAVAVYILKAALDGTERRILIIVGEAGDGKVITPSFASRGY